MLAFIGLMRKMVRRPGALEEMKRRNPNADHAALDRIAAPTPQERKISAAGGPAAAAAGFLGRRGMKSPAGGGAMEGIRNATGGGDIARPAVEPRRGMMGGAFGGAARGLFGGDRKPQKKGRSQSRGRY